MIESLGRCISKAPTLIFPLFAVLIITVGLFLAGFKTEAKACSVFGSTIVVFGNLAYITLFRSCSRWEGMSFSHRLGRVFFLMR